MKYEFQTKNTNVSIIISKYYYTTSTIPFNNYFLIQDTLVTMTENAYVNHVPTLTGGVGKKQLYNFYSKHFITQMPPDTITTPISRTIGSNQIVDEMIFKFTHTVTMDFMLPRIKPTGRYVEVALVAIVHFIDDKISHEHIYWDQASVLKQLGLLPQEVDNVELPVVGIESAHKVFDSSLPAMEWGSSSVDEL